jgi:hypothetical protein
MSLALFNKQALNRKLSNSSGSFSTTSTSFVDVTNLSVSFISYGNAIVVGLIPDGAGAGISAVRSAAGIGNVSRQAVVRVVRDSTEIARFFVDVVSPSGFTASFDMPAFAISTEDSPGVGSYTYKLQAAADASGNHTTHVINCKLRVLEL